jgi:Glycosyl transferase 4-like domain
MLAYTNYESDNRVRRYAETLAKRGDQVDVIALCGNSRQREKQINGITVSRIQNRDFNDRSKWTYASRLLRFLCRSSVSMARLHIRNRYDVIHVHNMPDFLVFAAWYPKLTGARLILDIHDIVPERFANEFKTRLRTAYVKLLQAIEKMSASFVDHVIVSNRLWRDSVSARSLEQGNCFVNGHGLRQTLVTRGYRHAERNSWDQKSQEYLDLVDSLSTERFDSVQPPATIDFGLPESHPRQTNASPMPKEIGQLAIKLQRSSTASASKIE